MLAARRWLFFFLFLAFAVHDAAGQLPQYPKSREKDVQWQFFQAIQNFKFDEAKQLLKNGASVNGKDEQDQTPLYRCCADGTKIEVIRFLIEQGADVNQEVSGGITPLIAVCEFHRHKGLNIELIKFLIESGARVEQADDIGETPLQRIAWQDKELYDWVLKRHGRKVPKTIYKKVPPEITEKSTEELLASLQPDLKKNPQGPLFTPDRYAVHRELLMRGEKIVPDLANALRAGIPGYYDRLVRCLTDDNAHAVIRILSEDLQSEQRAFMAIITIKMIRYDGLKLVNDDLKREGAENAYRHVITVTDPEEAGAICGQIADLGRPATPVILKLLNDKDDLLRDAMRRGLYGDVEDPAIVAQLLKDLKQEPKRREQAAQLLQLAPQTKEIRAALLAFILDPPFEKVEPKQPKANNEYGRGGYGTTVTPPAIAPAAPLPAPAAIPVPGGAPLVPRGGIAAVPAPFFGPYYAAPVLPAPTRRLNEPPLAPADSKYGRGNQFYKGLGEAANALGKQGPEVLDEILPLLTPLDNPRRVIAIQVLGTFACEHPPQVVALLSHDDRAIATAAMYAIRHNYAPRRDGEEPESRKLLRALIRKNEEPVTRLAIDGYAPELYENDELTALLLKVAVDKNYSDSSRVAAIDKLMREDIFLLRDKAIPVADFVPVCIRVLQEGTILDREAAAYAVGEIGPDAKSALAALKACLLLPEGKPDEDGFTAKSLAPAISQAMRKIESPDQFELRTQQIRRERGE